MAIKAVHNQTTFGVGDAVRVHQKVAEGSKTRTQIFEGMVIGIGGQGSGRSFVVRRLGAQNIGIEKIFPLSSPTIEKIEVRRVGVEGVRHAKLYYTRDKSKREIDRIYSRAAGKNQPQKTPKASKKTSQKAK